MEQVIRYKALDGKLFEQSSDCFLWEKQISELPLTIFWYDKNGNELTPTSHDEIETAWLQTTFIMVDKGRYSTDMVKEDLKFMHEYWDIMTEINSEGRFYYDGAHWNKEI